MIIRISDSDSEMIAKIRLLNFVRSAPAVGVGASRYGTDHSRYIVILQNGADVAESRKALKALGATIVESEFG